ncbi:MAG: hypothetical protein VX460_00885 [Planctomycetota bacterium]|nr:hypothetical protein [Planctomycetota bacterium]
MALHAVVGIGAGLDPEEIEDVLRLAVIDPVLEAEGLGPHREPLEPSSAVDLELGDEEVLGALKRVAAHVWMTGLPPLPGGGAEALDRYEAAARVSSGGRAGSLRLVTPPSRTRAFDHLVHHEEAEGLYLPADFAAVLLLPSEVDPLEHEPLGSAPRLAEECLRLAAAMDLPPGVDPEGDEIWAARDDPSRWGGFGAEGFALLRLAHAAAIASAAGAALILQ